MRTRGLILVAALALAACGSDDALPDADGTGPDPVEPSTLIDPTEEEEEEDETGLVPAAGRVRAIDADPCELLTADEVERATGIDVVAVEPDGPISCLFDLDAEARVGIMLSLDDGEGRMIAGASVFDAYLTELVGDEIEILEVTGLGQAALFSPRFRGLAVDAGDGRFIGIGVHGSGIALVDPDENHDLLVELAGLVVERLPAG